MQSKSMPSEAIHRCSPMNVLAKTEPICAGSPKIDLKHPEQLRAPLKLHHGKAYTAELHNFSYSSNTRFNYVYFYIIYSSPSDLAKICGK